MRLISKTFLKNSFIYTMAGALPIASGFILLPLYGHYLPIDLFGTLSIYTTFSVLIQIAVTYSFDTSIYIFFSEYKKDPQKLSVFISSAFIFILLLGFAVCLLSIPAGKVIFGHAFAGKPVSFYPFGFLSVITALFQALLKVHSSLLQSRGKAVVFFWSNFLSFSMIAGFSLAGIFLFPDTLIGPVGGRMLAAAITAGWVLVRIFREFGFHYDFKSLKPSFGFNTTSFIYQIQQWVINSLDRWIMGFYLTLLAVGIYDFAFKYLLIIDFIFAGLYNTFYPKVIALVVEQEMKESTIVINRYYYGIIAVTMLLVCVSILFFPLLIETGIIQSGYAGSLVYVPFLAVICLARGIKIYFSFPYAALKYNKPFPIIYLFLSVIKIGVMILLISRYQTFAVIISSFISTIIEIALLRTVIRGRFDFHFNMFKLILAPVLLGIVIVGMELGIAGYDLQRHVFYLIFCLGMLVWFYRNELKNLKPAAFFSNR